MLAPLVILCISALGLAFTFNVTSGAPAECGNITVSWTGGQPPFHLLIVPPGFTTWNVTIPDEAFANGEGSFTTQLHIPQGREIFFSMSDATSLVAGGASDFMTVGAKRKGANCNVTDPGTDFFFSLDSPLQQCKPYPFTMYTGAILPLTVLYYIPGGSRSFVLQSPPSGNSFSLTANVTGGTTIVFSVLDAHNRKGGNSGKKVVLLTDETSCLSGTSPHHSGISAGLAAGITVISLACLLVLAFLIFWFWRRWRRRLDSKHETSSIDLMQNPAAAQAPETPPYGPDPPMEYVVTPFDIANTPTEDIHQQNSQTHSFSHRRTSSSTKHRMAIQNPDNDFVEGSGVRHGPVSVIEHVDIEEILPKYTDRRSQNGSEQTSRARNSE